MSGHSKWSSIKHKKAKMDAQRSKVFSRLVREIILAAKKGGGNSDLNPRLRSAVQAAREANVPMDNITRAIKKGTGELPGVVFEEYTYEGYGPGGVAVMVEIVTDNKNRTSSEIRKIFSKNGGNLGSAGCVSWMFHQKGVMSIPRGKMSEDELMELAVENGAEDVKTEDEEFVITCAPENFAGLKESFVSGGVNPDPAEITMLPDTEIQVAGKAAEQLLNLAEELEEHPDTQNVYANFDIPDDILETLTG